MEHITTEPKKLKRRRKAFAIIDLTLKEGEVSPYVPFLEKLFKGIPTMEAEEAISSDRSTDDSPVFISAKISDLKFLKKRFGDRLVTLFIRRTQSVPSRPKMSSFGKRHDWYLTTHPRSKLCYSDLACIVFMELGGIFVAMDGGAGTGKGTSAKMTAKYLGGYHIDSGLFYRLVAFKLGILKGLYPTGDGTHEALKELCAGYHQAKELGEEVSEQRLRMPDVDNEVPKWGETPVVREEVFMLQLIAAYAGGYAVIVAEGRDMTTEVFRMAQHRFFIRCDVEIRAKRRTEWNGGNGKTYEENLASLIDRDEKDMRRKVSPLRYNRGGGVRLISNNGTLDETMEQIKLKLKRPSRVRKKPVIVFAE